MVGLWRVLHSRQMKTIKHLGTMYEYKELKEKNYEDVLEIRVKYQRQTNEVEYFDGARINPESVPEGKHLYWTRHSDNGDMAHPVTISPKPIIVNFCGCIVSDKPLNVADEVKLTYVSWI